MSENVLSAWGGLIRKAQDDGFLYLACQWKERGVNEWVLPKCVVPEDRAKRKRRSEIVQALQDLTNIKELKYLKALGDIRYAYRPPDTARVVIKNVGVHLLEVVGDLEDAPTPKDYHKGKWIPPEQFKKYFKYMNELRLSEQSAGL